MAAACFCRMQKLVVFSSYVLFITVNCIYSSKPFCYSVYYVKILERCLWTCCHLVPTLKVTDSFPNKIRHKLRQYSIKVIETSSWKIKMWRIVCTAAETKTHFKQGAGVSVNQTNMSLMIGGTAEEWGQMVVGWTKGCSTTVVQQLEMPDRRGTKYRWH